MTPQQHVIYEYDPATGQTVASELPDDFFTAAPEAPAHRQLNGQGKEKLRQCVCTVSSLEELADIETAIDAGHINDQLAAKLGLTDVDFLDGGGFHQSDKTGNLREGAREGGGLFDGVLKNIRGSASEDAVGWASVDHRLGSYETIPRNVGRRVVVVFRRVQKTAPIPSDSIFS
jgi:hypothetical protein